MSTTLSPTRTALPAAVAIAGINAVILGVGHLLGVDMLVARSADATASEVGIGSVVLMSIAPAVLGGLALWPAARRGVPAWRLVGWIGLGLGLLTVPIPFTMVATTATSATLASMHVTAGLVWFAAVRRTAAASHDRRDRRVPEPA